MASIIVIAFKKTNYRFGFEQTKIRQQFSAQIFAASFIIFKKKSVNEAIPYADRTYYPVIFSESTKG
jgi:hypothetical protein